MTDTTPTSPAEQIRRAAFRDVEHALRRHAEIWEADSSDPCRVRITLDHAEAAAAWADGRGKPDAPAAAWRRGDEPAAPGTFGSGSARDAVADLAGATDPGPEHSYPKDAGEFAARWNAMSPTRRELWVVAILDAAQQSAACFEQKHPALTAEREKWERGTRLLVQEHNAELAALTAERDALAAQVSRIEAVRDDLVKSDCTVHAEQVAEQITRALSGDDAEAGR